jgi:hypothetical protein
MGEKTLRSVPLHAGHSVSGSSLKDCTTSRCSPQLRHAYSYVGISTTIPELERCEKAELALGRFECQV